MGLISRVSSRTYRNSIENNKKMATKNQSLATVEATLERIKHHKGVVGYIIINSEGHYVKTTLDNSTTTQYQSLISSLAQKSRAVIRDLDPQDNLRFLRIKSLKHEIMVAPDNDYTLIVIQDPQ